MTGSKESQNQRDRGFSDRVSGEARPETRPAACLAAPWSETAMPVKIIPERAEDAALIDPLLDRTFGPEREAKTVYRLRRGLAPIAALSFVAIDESGQGLASG